MIQKQNMLAETIDMVADKAKYDACAKKILSQKVILAWILKECTEEFAQYSIDYIMDYCIEGNPLVAQCAVHQDQLNPENTGAVGGMKLLWEVILRVTVSGKEK